MRAVEREERLLLAEMAAANLITLENGTPLGPTAFLDFGDGLHASLIADQYVRVTGAAGGGPGPWDALVDGSQTTDTSVMRFAGIGEALDYLQSLGMTSVAVAVRPYPLGSGSGYTETANWDMPANAHLFGLRGVNPLLSSTGPVTVHWNWNGFKPSSTGRNLRMDNFGQFEPGNFGGATVPLGAFVALNTHIKMGTFSTNAELCTTFYGQDVVFDLIHSSGTSAFCLGACVMVACSASLRENTNTVSWKPSTNGPLVTRGTAFVRISGFPRHTITLPGTFDVDLVGRLGWDVAGGSAIAANLIVPAGGDGRIQAGEFVTTGAPEVTATSAFGQLILEGTFGALTISGAHDQLLIHGLSAGHWDITGPADVGCSIGGGSRVILRGNGITARIDGDVSGSSGTFLDFIAADYCNVRAGVDGAGTSGTRKSFAFDANSDNNILDFAGDSTFAVAGTDAGAGNLIRVT